MIPYIITFILSLLFTYMASKVSSRVGRILLSILAISGPVILASFRDIGIGTDSLNYMNIYNGTKEYYSTTLKSYIDSSPESVEYFFLVYNYLCSKIFTEYQFYLILCYIIIITPVYIIAMSKRTELNPVFSMMFFYLVFYNESLNLMRQYISIIFAFMATIYLSDDKIRKSLIFSIIAIGIHNSSIIILIIYPIYRMLNKYSFRKYTMMYILLFLGIVGFLVSLDSLNIVILDSSERFSKYLNDQSGTLSSSTIILYLLIVTILFLSVKFCSTRKMEFFALIAFLAFIFNFASTISHTMYRLSLIFNISSCISIPYALNCVGKNNLIVRRKYFAVLRFLMISLVLYYWYFSVVLRGSNETYPYTSIILGIN